MMMTRHETTTPRALTDKNGEVRELTAEDMTHFRAIQETDPGMLEAVANYRKRGRPPVETPTARWFCS
jgi:hypothetical protein